MMARRSIRKPVDKSSHGQRESAGITIDDTFHRYIDMVHLARSQHTGRTYLNALKKFGDCLKDNDLDPVSSPIQELSEDAIAWFAESLKTMSPATEMLYLTAAAGYYQFLAAEGLLDVNLPRVRLLIHQRSRRAGQRLPQFPRTAIDDILDKADQLSTNVVDNENEKLRNLRDRAFLITLADTGLRVHEACNLRRGDIDWYENRAIVLGKGNREAVIRFSSRAVNALKEYLAVRSPRDGASGRPLTALPIFARHDKGAGKKIKPITPTTGRNIVTERVRELLGDAAVGSITPHSFRHYFVTRVLQSSGNLKLAQELARHRNIAVTQRYAHLSDDELDKGYWDAIEDHPNT